MIVSVARGSTSLGEALDYYLYDKADGEVLQRDGKSSPIEKAGDYALNDKGGARTSYRVGFTETINLDASDPVAAIGEMQARYDAFRAAESHKRGRKLQKPVYTYSLSWSPDENPSREEMIAAARSSLRCAWRVFRPSSCSISTSRSRTSTSSCIASRRIEHLHRPHTDDQSRADASWNAVRHEV